MHSRRTLPPHAAITLIVLAFFAPVRVGGFESAKTDWRQWSPRPEIAPECTFVTHAGRSGGTALAIETGGNAAAYGGWQRQFDGIAGGRSYRLVGFYRAEGVENARRSVTARLEWLDAAGRRLGAPEYGAEAGNERGWTRVEQTSTSPEAARSARVTLVLGWAPKGRVFWDGVALEQGAASNRKIRLMTVYHRPRNMKSPAEAVDAFCRVVESAAERKPDVVCLPEGITVIGTGKSYAEVSETIPGPTTAKLGELARKLRSYVVAGIYERSGATIYNTAVLIDRAGNVAGSYRKTHLPYEEAEAGLTPGDSYPVFQTDFGKLGIEICWDIQFPEPSRAMAAAGADLLLVPIWGGNETLAKARAIENHVFLVTSSYDMKTFIVDPAGAVLAEASAAQPVAVAEVDLDRKILQPWLGDMKPRTWKERRPDIPVR